MTNLFCDGEYELDATGIKSVTSNYESEEKNIQAKTPTFELDTRPKALPYMSDSAKKQISS